MKTVEEVRRERLKMLQTEFGSLAALNELLELNRRDSTLSQYLNEAKGSKTSKVKVMGSPMARRLEQACGKEIGWMDTDPALTGEAGNQQTLAEYQALREKLRAEALAEFGLQAQELPAAEDKQHLERVKQVTVRARGTAARKRSS